MLTKADEIDNAAKQITKQLNSVKWVGNDAQRFRNDWNGRHTAALRWFAPAFVSGFGLRIKQHLYGLRDTFRRVRDEHE